LPNLVAAGKHAQFVAEVENLKHMRSCVNEMLKPDGLNFKPDFAAESLNFQSPARSGQISAAILRL
jgi:hypothetical protein